MRGGSVHSIAAGLLAQNPDMHRVIHIHPAAPAKPPEGSACNGCGVCCAAEPCPVGMLVSRRRHGACQALVWSDEAARYLCGLIAQPQRFVRPAWLARGVSRLARRFVAAGIGCDSDLEVAQAKATIE
jgi:hypothetical protein